jgi:hypothetical protein
MPTPADDLAQLLAAVLAYRPQPRAWPTTPHVFGAAQTPRVGRLRPLLAGRPHPRRRLGRWGGDGVVRLTLPQLDPLLTL